MGLNDDPNLELLYNCDEQTGNLADSSANDNVGTLNGAMSQDHIGKFGRAIKASGANSDFLRAANTIALPGDFTLAAWVNSPDLNQNGLFGHSPTVAFLRTWSATLLSFSIPTGDNPDLSGVTLPLDTWFHLACVRTGASFTYYIDGVDVGTAANTNASQVDFNTFANSSPNAANPLEGLIDDIRIYSRALTPAEITELQNPYNAPTEFTATVISDTQIDLTWIDVP